MIASPSALEGLPADIRNLVAAIVESRSFQRLKNVSFLGAIDRFSSHEDPHDAKTSGSRLDHSLGVAEIIFSIAGKIDLTPGELRIAIANALLHDIGHGPFSHSSEPYFSNVFGVDHHKTLLSIIEDADSEVSRTLRGFGLWFDYRKFVRSHASIPAVSDLFFGPINVDTIEGIVRSADFFHIETSLSCANLAASISKKHVRVRPLDLFWGLKSEVYNNYIFASEYAFYDENLTRALYSISNKVRFEHFFLDDLSFEQEFGGDLSRFLQQEPEFAACNLQRRRRFQINRSVGVRQFRALDGRYAEVKSRGGEWLRTKELSRKVENLQIRE